MLLKIEDRIKKIIIIKNKLNIKKENKCLKLYKIENGNPIYRIGSNIILKKRIGSRSKNGIIFLTSFKNKNEIQLKYISKIIKLNKQTKLDLKIQEKLTNLINKCPHFPILYGYYICNKIKEIDSYNKINSKEILIKDNKNIFGEIIQNKKYLITFSELANGDLKIFLKKKLTEKIILNILCQIILSLIFYNQETKKIHNDIHEGNFLYYKIKKGGYFHYKIYGKDYYLENIGYLWIIIDYEYSEKISNNISYIFDYSKIFNLFIIKRKRYNIDNKIEEIYNKIFKIKYDKGKEGLKELIKKIINVLENNKILLNKIGEKSKINNEIPYKINF